MGPNYLTYLALLWLDLTLPKSDDVEGDVT